MARVKRGVTAHAKHKKVLKKAKGYYGRRKNTIRIAKQAVEKALQYAYRDRKRSKRTFRALWIQRINAAVARARPDLRPIHRRPRQGRHRGRPQGPGRSRRARAAGFKALVEQASAPVKKAALHRGRPREADRRPDASAGLSQLRRCRRVLHVGVCLRHDRAERAASRQQSLVSVLGLTAAELWMAASNLDALEAELLNDSARRRPAPPSSRCVSRRSARRAASPS